jgi:hypothetical protein
LEDLAVLPHAIREMLVVKAPITLPTRRKPDRRGPCGKEKDMLAAFAGIGLVFIAVVTLSIVTMLYVMLRQA